MKYLAFTVFSLFATCVIAAGPMDFKGKMKEGLYDMSMSMEMSGFKGMPQGMKLPATNMQHCLTKKDIEEGSQTMLGQKDAQQKCEMKDFKMSGDTANYKMVCSGQNPMEMETTMTFSGNNNKGVSKIKMNQNGQAMTMTSNFESKYLGACKS